jgi:hypothetical protein
LHFPDSDGDKCHKDFWTRFVPRRIKHHAFVFSLWFLVYQIGQFFTGEGAWFVLSVSVCARCGYGTAWFMITNFTHSHWWNEILCKRFVPGFRRFCYIGHVDPFGRAAPLE